jgi:myo-inositol-1-phosphate synthase
MALEENLDEFKCALSEDKHFIVESILLIKCGHSACKVCLPNDNTNIIKCKTCDVVSEFDFKSSKVSIALRRTMKYVYEDIYKILETDMNSKLNYLKSNLFIACIEMIE